MSWFIIGGRGGRSFFIFFSSRTLFIDMAKTEVKCESCGKLFHKENKEINRCRKRGIGNYCSNSCVAKYRNKSMSESYWKDQYEKYPQLEKFNGNRQDEYSPFRTFINKGRFSIKKKDVALICNI